MSAFEISSVLYQPVNPHDRVDHLVSYIQPKLNEDGSCPIFKEPGETYHLDKHAVTDNERFHLHDLLVRLNRLTAYVYSYTGVAWFGIYLQRGDQLVKFAYHGEMSRAEFPIDELYKEKSTNTRVFLENTIQYIPDVDTHEGPYYRCDAKVKSELCCPLVGLNGTPMGIFDAEDFRTHFFDESFSWFTEELKPAVEWFLHSHPFFK